MGWEHHKQCFVTRHQTNFIIDTSKSIFENMNVFLSHMNGILSYEAGKYVLRHRNSSNCTNLKHYI